jgi:hypothetical protein
MSRRTEYDAAYFTLLRAREEFDHLRRYADYLSEELGRLQAVTDSVNDDAEVVPRKFRRMVDGTDRQLLEAVGRRRAIIQSELRKVPQRIEAQEAFVAECEEELAALR